MLSSVYFWEIHICQINIMVVKDVTILLLMPKHSDKQQGKSRGTYNNNLWSPLHLSSDNTHTHSLSLHNHMPTYSLTLPEECSVFQVVDDL